MFRETLLETDGARLNVAQGGDGPPLVLLHGVTRGWRTFAAVMPTLAGRWRIFAPDMRGHGRSARTPGKYAVVDYVGDIVSLLERHVDGPAVVMGHSLGSMVALAVAAAAPERVRALVMEDPPFDTMGARVEVAGLLSYFQDVRRLAYLRLPVPELAKALAEIPVKSPATGETVRLGAVRDGANLRFAASCLAVADPEILDPIVAREWLVGYDHRKMFTRLRCPSLLLQGDASLGGMLMDDDASAARTSIADCVHVRLANVGHNMHGQAAEAWTRVVHSFLESL